MCSGCCTGWLYVVIFNHIHNKGGKCRVIVSPFAVFLKDDNRNYVEPDIVVICRRDRLDNQGCHGAPDWVIEVVWPSSQTMDYCRKLEEYRSKGILDYRL